MPEYVIQYLATYTVYANTPGEAMIKAMDEHAEYPDGGFEIIETLDDSEEE